MKIMNIKKWVACIVQLAMALAVMGAAAQDDVLEEVYDDSTIYLGVGGGVLVVPKYCDYPSEVNKQQCQDSEEAFHAYLGYKFSKNFALEAGWMQSRGFKASGRYADEQALGALRDRTWDMGMNIQATHLALRGNVEVLDWMDVTGLVGAYFWERDLNLGGDILVSGSPGAQEATNLNRQNRQKLLAPNKDNNGIDFVGGAGLEMALGGNFATQWRWMRYVGQRYDGDYFSIDFTYGF